MLGREPWTRSRLSFPIAPLLLMLYVPGDDRGHLLALVGLASGLAAGRIHLKQSTWRARRFVFVGFLVAAGLGTFPWLMGLLAIAFLFASTSASQANLVNSLVLAFTALMLLVVPPLGAWSGSRAAASRSARG